MDTKDSDTKLHDNGETHPHAHDEPMEEKEALDFGQGDDADDTPPPQAVHDVTQDIVEDIPEEILEDIPERPGEGGAIQDSVPPARDLVIETETPEAPGVPGDIPMGQEPPGLEPQLRSGPQRGRRDQHGRPMQGGHGRDRGRDRNRDRHRDNRDHGRDHNRDHNRDRGPRPEIRRDIKIVKNEILVNCSPEETRVGVVEDNQLIELMVDRTESEKIVGNIYKGRVDNVLPGISSAFVNIGLEKNAYLYVSDVI